MALLEHPATVHAGVEMDDWGGKSGTTMLLCLRDYLTGEVQCHTITSLQAAHKRLSESALVTQYPGQVLFRDL